MTPDGPADKAGLKVRDIILTLNGRTMQDAPQLETAIFRLKLSETVNLTVLRDGQKLDYTVPVIERDDDPQRFADMVNPDDNLVSKLGILGIEINEKLSAMLGDLRHEYGIVVAARAPNPPYTGGTLAAGDVIYEVNRTPVVSIKALRATLDELKPGDPAILQIERNGKLMYITARVRMKLDGRRSLVVGRCDVRYPRRLNRRNVRRRPRRPQNPRRCFPLRH